MYKTPLLVFLLSSVVAPAVLFGQDRTLRYHDGDKEIRVVMLDDEAVADVLAQRLERFDDEPPGLTARYTSEVARVITQIHEASEPLFYGAGGLVMALPGGVILSLERDLAEEAVDRFFSRNGISRSRVKKLGAVPNVYLIATERGLPALHLANDLHGQDGVRSSVPDWWREQPPPRQFRLHENSTLPEDGSLDS